MKQETKRSVKKGIANTFGSFGYLFGFLQWIWAAALYLSVIQSVTSLISSSDSSHYVERPVGLSLTLPGPLGVIVLTVVVAAALAITVYAFFVLPRSIVKTSNKIVYKTAESMTPIVIKAQHKHDTKRNRIKITSRLVIVLKALLILVPLTLTVMSRLLQEQPIDYSIALTVGCGLACFSMVAFVVQYFVAMLLRVKISDLW
ncbi:MAG: rane protein of unknown function [Candidatus Saccharibacteria bacterium]|nr:rane protein of unknown function [Candidatus Saccharibacteria bacterium]